MWFSPRIRPLCPLVFICLALSGCANPGPPRPPSLKLPTPVKDLHAERIGDQVHLAWTTPGDTTDDLPLKEPISAEICRQLDHPASAPCLVVQHLAVHPGPGTAVDPLPIALLADPAHLLRYRIRLLNPAGRSADASNTAFAASGLAPVPVADLHIAYSSAGTRILWQPVSTADTTVLLDRTTIIRASQPPEPSPPAPPHLAAARLPGKPRHPSATSPPAASTLRLQGAPSGPDPGGTLDTTAGRNSTYSYTAWRSRSVQIAGKPLTLRSPDSPPLPFTVHDTIPPATPTGLEAIVENIPDRATDTSAASFVDLSWEPGSDPDLLGYWIERAAAPDPATPAGPEVWQRLNPAPLPGPSFRDRPPAPGTFLYRVLATDTTGNLSPPTPPVSVRVLSPSAP